LTLILISAYINNCHSEQVGATAPSRNLLFAAYRARVERTLLSAAFDVDFDLDPRTPGRNEFQELREKLTFALCFWVAQRFTAAIKPTK
jgi:hypothetical protein